MIALIVILGLLTQQVGGNPIRDADRKLIEKSRRLRISFLDTMQEVFYDQRRVAEDNNNGPMLEILASIGRMELTHYRLEQGALSMARHVIRSLDDARPKTENLLNLITSRVIQQACEREVTADRDARKRLYLLFTTYNHDSADIRQLARQYSMRIKSKEYRALRAKDIMQKFLEQYRGNERVTEALNSVDELIHRANTQSGNPEPDDHSIGQLSRDLEAATQMAYGRVTRMSQTAMDQVDMNRVQAYEDAQAQAYLDAIRQDIERKRLELDEEFRTSIQKYFYVPQLYRDDHVILALAADMAEAEGLMYASSKKMLSIVEQIITDCFVGRKALKDPLVKNKNLIDIIVQRSEERGLDKGFSEVKSYRRRLYLLRDHTQSVQVRELARIFYETIKRAEQRLEEAASNLAILKKYNDDVLFLLPDSPLFSETEKSVNLLINDAVTKNNNVMKRKYSVASGSLKSIDVLEHYVGSNLMNFIRSARQKTAGLLEQFSVDTLERVHMDAVEEYEDSVLRP